MQTTSTSRPRTPGHTYEVADWPDSCRARTPRIGRPRVTKMLQTPTVVMAAVLAVGPTP